MSSSRCSCVLKPLVGSDCGGENWLSINKREEDDDDELMKPGQDEVWKAIQAQKQQGDGDHTNNKAPPIRSTVSWSAILLSDDQKVVLQDSPPPYIHPLLKKSSSCCLSKHSLQICTESLGSETGSDCLSSHDSDHIQNEVQDNKQAHEEEEEEDIFNHVKINYSKKSPSPPSSFPPPLPSLANSSVQLRSHRQGKGEGEVEGSRLILEAVSIPQRNYFHAERSHGRLLLTALTSPSSSHEEEEEEAEAGDDETEEFEIHNSSSDEEGEGEGSGHATMPSFNSNTNHLYSNSGSSRSISIAEYKQQQQELLRNCKEARRRSLLTWEPPNYCIATSS